VRRHAHVDRPAATLQLVVEDGEFVVADGRRPDLALDQEEAIEQAQSIGFSLVPECDVVGGLLADLAATAAMIARFDDREPEVELGYTLGRKRWDYAKAAASAWLVLR
jgi:hypothetical protein